MKRIFALVALVFAIPTAAVATHSFSDVPDGRYFTEPVEWAAENEITTGKSPTIFDPAGVVTRGEAVTFLKRYHDNVVQPAFDDLPDSTVSVRLTGRTLPEAAMSFSAETGVNTDMSVAIRDSGLPIIAGSDYIDFNRTDLWVFDCAVPDCSVGASRLLESGSGSFGRRGWHTDIEIGADGNPVIVHYDRWPGESLRIFVCSDPNCTAGTGSALDETGDTGFHPDVAIRPDGTPLIVYADLDTETVDVYACDDATCTSGGSTQLATMTNSAVATAQWIGVEDGSPMFAYIHDDTDDLRLFSCSNIDCTSGSDVSLAADVDWQGGVDAAVGIDGLPHISFVKDGQIQVYRCAATDCSSGESRDVTASGSGPVALGVGVDGMPVIVLRTAGATAAAFICTAMDCSEGHRYDIDSVTNSGYGPAVTTGANGDLIAVFREGSVAGRTVTFDFEVTGVVAD